MDIHSSRGMKEGVTLDKIAALDSYATDPRFTARERAAINFAERMTRTDLDVTDAAFAAAREEFSVEEMVELAGVIALENFRSKFNNAFRIEAQGFCAIPENKG
jgi:alkylhydroperoxidase family enzyme